MSTCETCLEKMINEVNQMSTEELQGILLEPQQPNDSNQNSTKSQDVSETINEIMWMD